MTILFMYGVVHLFFNKSVVLNYLMYDNLCLRMFFKKKRKNSYTELSYVHIFA